jgi:uncharacterized protein YjbI with pentapeptide repeats
MTSKDISQMPLFSPDDEKEAQKELKRLRKNENGVFKVNHKRTGFEDKTLWDWLQLLGILAIPLVVAGATLLFSIQQANLANQQHEADRQQALDQQQAAILQTYLDSVQDLLLHNNLLKSSLIDTNNPYYDVAILARARTLTALQGLDPMRKGRLLQFIDEALLIGFMDDQGKLHIPIIILSGADLSFADLSFVYLRGADLSGANLRGAKLGGAFLTGTNFTGADLSGADLSYTSDLTQKQLDEVGDCKNAILPEGLTCHRTGPWIIIENT